VARCGTVGNTSSIAPDPGGELPNGGAENGEQGFDLARPAAWQNQNKRRIGAAALCLLGIRTQFGKPLDQRMADVEARRTVELDIHGRLKRQNGENAIDIGAHRPRAPRTPRPHRRRYVIEDGDFRRPPPHPARHAMREIGLSMMTSASGRAATTASAVSRMRRKIVGSRCARPAMPMIERSSMAKGLTMPAAAMARPPTPASFTPSPARAVSARANAPPQRIAGFLTGDEID
jgi:hypothetical protein